METGGDAGDAHCNGRWPNSLYDPGRLRTWTSGCLMGFASAAPLEAVGFWRYQFSIMSGNGSQLEVLYDNGPCLVINKPAGILTQAPAGIDSLEVRVREFYRQREGKAAEANFYLGLPHRLDRPVSGAIVFARHARAAQRLATQFENRTVTKVYWAIVEGDVPGDEGTWTDHLHKRHGMAQSIVVPPDDPRGKLAVMHWRVMSRGREPNVCPDGQVMYSVLEVQLETGRTHQIRVQAASRGFPILGDAQYGARLPFGEQNEDERLRSIALHARQLGFNHPTLSETVDVLAPLPLAWKELDHFEVG